MKHITGLKKDLALLKNSRSKNLRMLPFGIRWYLRDTFKNEKFTKIHGKYVINTFMPPFPSEAFERLIKNTVSGYKQDLFPYSTYLAVTNQCSFNCWHCSRAYRKGNELYNIEWIKIIKKLQDIGVSIIGFTGGEPLLRSNLEEMIEAVDERATTVLFTTGDGLNDDRARRLEKAGLTYIAISLDHYDKEEHNKFRGSEKAFDIAVEAVKTSLKHDFYTALQLTVRKDFVNLKDMDEYVKFANFLGVQEVRIIEPMPTGKLIKKESRIFLNDSEHEFLKQFHVKINKRANLPKIASFTYLEDKDMYGCGAGTQHLYIDAFGNLCPCDFTPISFGNVLKDGFDVCYQRIKKQFDRPRDKCFILENMEKICSYYGYELPLDYEKTKELCRTCSKGDLPRFYKKLGWKQ